MKTKLSVFSLSLAALLLSFSGAVFAHHGASAYDMTKPVVVKGTIKEFVWANPHCLIEFDVQDDKGGSVHWAGEVGSPSALGNQGWNRNSLRPGDAVTVYIFQAKTGAPVGRIGKVVLPDGKFLLDSATGRAVSETDAGAKPKEQ
jgi:hypothetical protein